MERTRLPVDAFDLTNTPMVILNEDRQIVHANASFLAISGYDSVEHVRGKRPGEAIDCVHASLFEAPGGCGTGHACSTCGALTALLKSHVHGKADNAADFALTYGRSLSTAFKATRIMLEGEEFIVASFVDIGDQIWRQDVERIFLHDIMNTAAAVMGILEMAELHDEAAGLPTDDTIMTESCRLARQWIGFLTEEILSYKTMMEADSGTLEPRASRFRLFDLIAQTAEAAEHLPCAKDRRIVSEYCDKDVLVTCDRTLLGTVLMNLVKNALEAVSQGDEVRVSCVCVAGTARIAVWNASVIPEAHQHHIFQRMFTTKRTGHGLGLYGSRLITERYLGGSIDCISGARTGTTFTIGLPITALVAKAPAA
ncbi:MAG: PAS domain-containing sensor histidine kinase [Rhodospirillaceae bacterium]|nr:PAS domain-containing sensor histidine kinase [Rhodospirillaceae bacterium]